MLLLIPIDFWSQDRIFGRAFEAPVWPPAPRQSHFWPPSILMVMLRCCWPSCCPVSALRLSLCKEQVQRSWRLQTPPWLCRIDLDPSSHWGSQVINCILIGPSLCLLKPSQTVPLGVRTTVGRHFVDPTASIWMSSPFVCPDSTSLSFACLLFLKMGPSRCSPGCPRTHHTSTSTLEYCDYSPGLSCQVLFKFVLLILLPIFFYYFFFFFNLAVSENKCL